MIDLISQWFRKKFSDPQAAILSWVLLLFAAVIYLFGNILAPVFAALVITYLLDYIVNKITNRGIVSRKMAVVIVFLGFLAFIIFLLAMVLPLVLDQLSQFIVKVPSYIEQARNEIKAYVSSYPDFFNPTILDGITGNATESITKFTEEAVGPALSMLPAGLTNALIYLVMVPMLTLFLLKDKEKIVDWSKKFLPKDHRLASRVWTDMDQQLGNYIRGKIFEIIIVGITTYLGFIVFDLNYALMLAVLVGFSVLIPYVGAIVVTIPVILVAYIQFGASDILVYVLAVYFIIQALDGYVLVPLLFSEATNMHPAAIIVAILFFGGIWGFWGLFFAIPLASLVQALILVWPGTGEQTG